MQQRHLREAGRHIAVGERHIAEQEARIVNLGQRGHDTTLARRLLASFRATQAQHIAYRELIIKELSGRATPENLCSNPPWTPVL